MKTNILNAAVELNKIIDNQLDDAIYSDAKEYSHARGRLKQLKEDLQDKVKELMRLAIDD